MNKIIRAALAAKFQGNVDNILTVVNATPNPEMATEILLGIYEPVQLSKKVENRGEFYTLISVDEWSRQVVYSYERKKSISTYFPEGTKKEDVTLENFKSLQKEGKRDVYIRIETDEIEKIENTTSIESWFSYKPVKPVIQEEEQIF